MRARQIIGGVVVLALLGGAVWAWRALLPGKAGADIETASPSFGEFVVSLNADGVLQSDDAVTVLNGEASGKITMIVENGSTVRAGDVFCGIEARELERSEADAALRYKQALEEIDKTRQSAEEEFKNTEREVEQAQKRLDLSKESNTVRLQKREEQLKFDRAEEERLRVEYDSKKRLAAKGFIPGTEVQIAKVAYESHRFKIVQSAKDLDLERRRIESALRKSERAVEAARQKAEVAKDRIEEQVENAEERAERTGRELERVRAQLADTTVRAPASGIVALQLTSGVGEMRPLKVGDQVYSRQRIGTISGTENMSVSCRVREMNVASVWKDQPVEIEFEALPGRPYSGTVSTVSAIAREIWAWEDPKADPNVRVFEVWVNVDQSDPAHLKPGLNAKLAFIIKRLPQALYLPLDSVFERGGKSLVYVRRGDRFVPRPVNVGDRNDVAVVIRSGLARRDLVAMADPTRAPAAEEKQ